MNYTKTLLSKKMNYIEKIKSAEIEKDKLTVSIKSVVTRIKSLEDSIEDYTEAAEKEIAGANAGLIEKMKEAGAEYIFFDLENADSYRGWVEDDGTLHINVGKVRACFLYKGVKNAVAKAKRLGVVNQ